MALIVRKDLLPTLIDRLKDRIEFVQIHDEAEAFWDGNIEGTEFLVDQWPNFQVVIVRPDATKPMIYLRDSPFKVCSVNDKALENLLEHSDVFTEKGTCAITVLTNSSVPTIKNYLERQNLRYHWSMRGIFMFCTKDTFKPRKLPEGLVTRGLQPEQSEIVSSTWKYSFGDASTQYIKHLIATQPSCCLYTEDGQLVGWALTYHFGWPGCLYVWDKFRHKGFAKVIMSEIVHQHFRSGKNKVYIWIEENNNASIKLNVDIGFQVVPNILTADIVTE